jgi:hypothetical protein
MAQEPVWLAVGPGPSLGVRFVHTREGQRESPLALRLYPTADLAALVGDQPIQRP